MAARSGSVAALAGAEVYTALGAGANISYWSDVQNGTHCAVRPEWQTPLQQSIQRFLRNTGSAPGRIQDLKPEGRQPRQLAGLDDTEPHQWAADHAADHLSNDSSDHAAHHPADDAEPLRWLQCDPPYDRQPMARWLPGRVHGDQHWIGDAEPSSSASRMDRRWPSCGEVGQLRAVDDHRRQRELEPPGTVGKHDLRVHRQRQ